MRMKKILILAVAAIALAACSRTFETHQVEPTQIGFNTWAEHMTKARTITDAAFSADDNFNVFGSKNGSAVVFNGDVVTYGTPVWTYTNPRYWDINATSYTFFAISPAGLLPDSMTDDQKTTAATSGAFSTKPLSFDGTVANDVLIAKKTVVPQATYTGDNPNYVVNLDFNHVASLLDVKVKKSFALKDATVKVTAISLENIVYKGTFSVSEYVTTAGDDLNKPVVAIANWTPAASESTKTFTGTVDDGGTALNQYGYASVTGEALNGSDQYFWQNFVVMPQSLTTQQIKISYKIISSIGEENVYENKTVAFTAFDLVDNKNNNTNAPDAGDGAVASGWNPNIHYIYTLTLDANKIDFTASITPWATTSVNGFYNLLN